MSGLNLLVPDHFGRGDITPRPEAFMGLRLTGETMGTSWSASWCSAPGLPETTVRDVLETSFSQMIASLSLWDPESLISRYNLLSPGDSLTIDEPFTEVLAIALDVARRSDGALDPCLGGEVLRQGFGAQMSGASHKGRAHGPDVWSRLQPEPGRLHQPGGVTLDLNAVAKGYAVDQMARTLEGFGITQYLVEIGGEFVGRGVKPDRSPWWVDLENPSAGERQWRIALVGHGLATSGDYRQQRQRDGKPVSHIVTSPGRVSALGDLASVSVIAPSCALADAWATAIFALGDEAGLALANNEGLPVLLQYRNAPARLSQFLSGWTE